MSERMYVIVLLLFLPAAGTLSAQDSTSTHLDTTAVDAATVLSPTSSENHERFMRRWRFVTGAALDFRATQDGTNLNFVAKSQPLSLTKEELQQFKPPRDFVAEDLYRRQMGTVPPLDFNPILQSGARLLRGALAPRKSPQTLTSLPSPLETDVLVHLWQSAPATGGQLYAGIDTTWRVTAKDLNNLLADMVTKGLLDRKKISPENQLGISTPLGVVSVELSGLNRKNQEYIYWPLVDRHEMITYLDAQLYLASSATPTAADGRSVSYQQSILQTLYRLSAAPSSGGE
jgi:hypothetical protein